MEFFRKIGIVYLLGKTAIRLCPNEEYEKYLLLLVKLILLVMLLHFGLSIRISDLTKGWEEESISLHTDELRQEYEMQSRDIILDGVKGLRDGEE